MHMTLSLSQVGRMPLTRSTHWTRTPPMTTTQSCSTTGLDHFHQTSVHSVLSFSSGFFFYYYYCFLITFFFAVYAKLIKGFSARWKKCKHLLPARSDSEYRKYEDIILLMSQLTNFYLLFSFCFSNESHRDHFNYKAIVSHFFLNTNKPAVHYSRYAFSGNNKPTMEPIPNPNVEFGTGTQMSQNDITRLNRLYKC